MTDSGLLTGLTHLVEGRTRSISPENFHGEKGKGGMATEGTGKNCARELGQGWKISPSVDIPGKGRLTLAEIEGSGIIQHIWLTCPHEDWRCTGMAKKCRRSKCRWAIFSVWAGVSRG